MFLQGGAGQEAAGYPASDREPREHTSPEHLLAPTIPSLSCVGKKKKAFLLFLFCTTHLSYRECGVWHPPSAALVGPWPTCSLLPKGATQFRACPYCTLLHLKGVFKWFLNSFKCSHGWQAGPGQWRRPYPVIPVTKWVLWGQKSSMGFLSPCKALMLTALGPWLLELSLGAGIDPCKWSLWLVLGCWVGEERG